MTMVVSSYCSMSMNLQILNMCLNNNHRLFKQLAGQVLGNLKQPVSLTMGTSRSYFFRVVPFEFCFLKISCQCWIKVAQIRGICRKTVSSQSSCNHSYDSCFYRSLLSSSWLERGCHRRVSPISCILRSQAPQEDFHLKWRNRPQESIDYFWNFYFYVFTKSWQH